MLQWYSPARRKSPRPALAVVLILCWLSVFAAVSAREPAPRFNAKTMSGETFTNSSVKGKVVLLQFWATWCPYCRGEQQIVDDIQKEFASNGLIVLAVDVGESKKKVKQYLQENPRKCRIVLTEDTNLAAMYAATRYPIYVVIDRDGNIAAQQNGAAGERALRRMLSQAGLESQPDTESQ
ncbi:MAG: TlpA family protein disulfide reductase [Terriglobales bacterium]